MNTRAIKTERRRLENLFEHLKSLESRIQCTKTEDEDVSLGHRVKNAAMGLFARSQQQDLAREKELENHPERTWYAKVLKAESKLIFKNLEMRELEERIKYVASVGDKFQKLLPPGVADRLKHSSKSPGDIAVLLSKTESECEKCARHLLELRGKDVAMQSEIDSARIAFSNINSLTELSAFEKRVLDTPSKSMASMPKASLNGFGVSFVEELLSEKQNLNIKTNGMEQELKKFRTLTVALVNAAEKYHSNPPEINNQIIEECEILAAKYLKEYKQDM